MLPVLRLAGATNRGPGGPEAFLLNSWSYFGGLMPDVLTPEQKRRYRPAAEN